MVPCSQYGHDRARETVQFQVDVNLVFSQNISKYREHLTSRKNQVYHNPIFSWLRAFAMVGLKERRKGVLLVECGRGRRHSRIGIRPVVELTSRHC